MNGSVLYLALSIILFSTPVGAQTPAPTMAGSPEDDPSEQLRKSHQQLQEAYQHLMMGEPGEPPPTMPGGVPIPGAQVPMGLPLGIDPAALGQLQKILEHPKMQNFARLGMDPEFLNSVTQVAQHPERPKLLYAEIGLLIAYMIFRAWRLSKRSHWAAHLWIRFYSFVGYTFLASFGVPKLILGDAYGVVVTRILRALIS